jgi:chaperonin GroES
VAKVKSSQKSANKKAVKVKNPKGLVKKTAKAIVKKSANKVTAKSSPKKASGAKSKPVVAKKTVKALANKPAAKSLAKKPKIAKKQKTSPTNAIAKPSAKLIKASPSSKKMNPKANKPTIRKTSASLGAIVTPLDDRVLIKVLPKETRTAGGLYIPESVTENQNTEGIVVAVGRGHQDKKGRMRPMEVQVGQKVLFAKYNGSQLKLENQEFVFIRENEILGLVD